MSPEIVYERRKGRYPHSFRINDEGFWRPQIIHFRNSMHAWARENDIEFDTAMNGLETNLRTAADAALFKLRWMGQ